MADPLPQPRVLLTSLLNTLTSLSTVPLTNTQAQSNNHQGKPNPLKLLPPSARPLLATLHVIYPTLVLPALDLLDRRLVTRVLVLGPPSSSSDEEAQARLDAQAGTFHIVRSAQQPRRGGSRENLGPMYVVRLEAWNCSCAAFAFAAFPAEVGTARGYEILGSNVGNATAFGTSNGMNTGREFGGLSTDGQQQSQGDGAGVPCCKHLLACVLSERWSILNDYVEERKVTKEEGAGLIGGI